MSKLTGKCDLYDHVYEIGSYGHPVNKKEKFEIFKQRTNGTIYMEVPVVLTKKNVKYFLEHDDRLSLTDKGEYQYLRQIFRTLNKLNKFGYRYKRPIKFETMLDLVPYLSHVITFMVSNVEKEVVYITELPWHEQEYLDGLNYGYEHKFSPFYIRQLRNEYKEALESDKSNI